MRRVAELDAVRGVAAIFIVMMHLGLVRDTIWCLGLVDLFFVVSGYLVTANVLKGSHTPGFFGNFFARRCLRIWPAYYLALVACLVVNRYLPWDHRPRAWLHYLTFTQNIPYYLGRPMPAFSGMFVHTWTMAIEEQFCLFWPFLVYLAGRKRLVPVSLIFVVVPLVLRALGLVPFLLLTRCDGLALGALLASLTSDADRFRSRVATHRLAYLLLGLAALYGPAWAAWFPAGEGPRWNLLVDSLSKTRVITTYFALIGLTFCVSGEPRLGVLRSRALCYVGRISYSLYLFHPLVFASMPRLYQRFVVNRMGIHSTLLMNVMLMGLCFLIADLCRRYVEEPFLALKGRFRGEATSDRFVVRADPGGLSQPTRPPGFVSALAQAERRAGG